MQTEPAVGTVAGWYPDPVQADTSRYWDGVGWTPHSRTHGGERFVLPDTPMPLQQFVVPADVSDIAAAQKLVIWAIVANLAAYAIRLVAFPRAAPAGLAAATALLVSASIGLVVALAATALSLTGVYRLAKALGYTAGWCLFVLALMFVPLVSLLTLLVVNERATKALRANGYKVGLMGARLAT